MARHANKNWNLSGHEIGDRSFDVTRDDMQIAVLMDIRRELAKLNRVFECPNFLVVPERLRRIELNTRKPRRRRKKV